MINQFELCRSVVRDVKNCAECLHHHECEKAGKPISLRAIRIYEVVTKYMPRLSKRLLDICTRKIRVTWLRNDYAECDCEPLAMMFLSLRIAMNRGGYQHLRIPVYFDDTYELVEARALRIYSSFMKGIK